MSALPSEAEIAEAWWRWQTCDRAGGPGHRFEAYRCQRRNL